ncbi:hypothetical protein AC1031_003806 [Aphanomyces cochlioides]|nr:hypothetical protein AC1031_003806 [Aphanomyces cochlioides]
MSSLLIHRYDDNEDLNPFLSVNVCEETKVYPMKGKSPVVIKLRLLQLDWRHAKQILVNAIVVICLVCLGIIPLVSYSHYRGARHLASQAQTISNSVNENALTDTQRRDLSDFRQFQRVHDEERRQGSKQHFIDKLLEEKTESKELLPILVDEAKDILKEEILDVVKEDASVLEKDNTGEINAKGDLADPIQESEDAKSLDDSKVENTIHPQREQID